MGYLLNMCMISSVNKFQITPTTPLYTIAHPDIVYPHTISVEMPISVRFKN